MGMTASYESIRKKSMTFIVFNYLVLVNSQLKAIQNGFLTNSQQFLYDFQTH